MTDQPISYQLGHANADAVAALAREFPESDIRQDVYRVGSNFYPTYIPAPAFIMRLNELLGTGWDFVVHDHGITADYTQVWVRATLTIWSWVQDPAGNWHRVASSRSQYGNAFLKRCSYPDGSQGFVNFGYDLKAAATDALRKCASLFGVAMHLYTKDEAPMQGMDQHEQAELDAVAAEAEQAAAQAPAEQFQIALISSMFERFGKPQREWMQGLGVSDLSQITGEMAQQVLSGTHPYAQSVGAQPSAPMTGQNA